MDKQLAAKLLPYINDKQFVDALTEYAEWRQTIVATSAMGSSNEEFPIYKGAWRELARLKQLRDTVLEVKDRK